MHERVTNQTSDRGVEETVPLGSYALVLFVWWREIILGTISVAAGAGAFLLTLQVLLPRYESSVDIAIIPTSARVVMDDRMRTGTPMRNREGRHRLQARQAALVGLVHNGNVARAVSERMRDKMESDDVKDAYLLTRIQADLVTNGEFSEGGTKNSDLIRITARADNPEKAANLADAWGEEYTDHVNLLYQQAPASVMRGVAAEAQRSQESYDVAQRDLEEFIRSSELAQLERRIQDKQHFIDVFRDLWKKSIAAKTANYESRQESRRAIDELRGAALKKSLEESYDVRQRLLLLQKSAQALRLKMEASDGSGIALNWLPLLMLNTDIYASTARLPDVLDLSVGNGSDPHMDLHDQIADLDGILNTLTTQIKSFNVLIGEQIERLQTYDDPDEEDWTSMGVLLPSVTGSDFPPQLVSLEKEIQVLTAAHSKAAAKLDDLTRERDIQRAALESLQNESIELLLMSASATTQVRLASEAVIPQVSAYPSPKLIAFLAGVVGLLITTCLAFLMNSIGLRPLLERTRSPSWNDPG